MAVASQTIAGECVEHATGKESGADQDVDDVEHGISPGSATMPPHAARMLRCGEGKQRVI
jgi:hypothetical protein